MSLILVFVLETELPSTRDHVLAANFSNETLTLPKPTVRYSRASFRRADRIPNANDSKFTTRTPRHMEYNAL
jgi:hypothetical protein